MTMGTVVAVVLLVPATLLVAYQLVRPSPEAFRRADAKAAESVKPAKAGGTTRPRRRQPAQSGEDYAALCNFTTTTDNGVQVDTGEAA